MTKRSLVFSLQYICDSYGGPIRSVETLARLFHRYGYHVIILQTNLSFLKPPNRFSSNYDVFTFWNFVFYLLTLDPSKRPTVVFNNQWTPVVQLLALILQLYNVRYVWWVRGVIRINSFKKHLVWRIIQSYNLNHAKRIVVTNLVAKRRVASLPLLNNKSISVIPNLAETNTIPFSTLHTTPNLSKHLCALYVGRLHRAKSIHDIILNLPPYCQGYSISLTIAGYPDDKDYLSYLSTLADSSPLRVAFALNISDTSKNKLIQMSDFFISLSQSENFGISVFEALSLGLPSIVHSKTDYWPHFNFHSLFSVQSMNLESPLSQIIQICRNSSPSCRAKQFQDLWKETQLDVHKDILNLVAKY